MSAVTHEDILIFAYQREEVRYKDLIREFVESGRCSRQTLTNRKTELEETGQLKKMIKLVKEKGKIRPVYRPFYIIPEQIKPEVEALIDEREVKKRIEELSPEEIATLRKQLEETEKTLQAAFDLLIQGRIRENLKKGQQFITSTEIMQVWKRIEYEKKRPKVGNLYGKREEALDLFLKRHGLTIEAFHKIKNGERLMNLLNEFEEYWKKEFFNEDRSTS